MVVAELAREARVPPHVVRYYARIGLLTPDRDPANGYRMFAPRDIERLRCIRLAKRLGYSLEEIRVIMQTVEQGVSPGGWMVHVLEQRLESTRCEIARLRQLETQIARALVRHSKAQPALPLMDIPALVAWMKSLLGLRPADA